MKSRMIFKISALLVLLVHLGWAQTSEIGVNDKKTGQSTMNFLQVGLVPSAVAVGEAYTAIGTGVQSIFYNPAGLDEMTNQFEVFGSTVSWIADIQYLAGAAAWKSESFGTIGVSFLTVDYGDIIGTSLIDETGIGYSETGMVDNVGAYAFGLTYSKMITNVFSVGIGVRYATQQLGQSDLAGGTKNNEESKVVFDLGVKYYTPIDGFRFAMSIKNFSNSVKYEEVSTQLPFTFAIGAAYNVMNLVDPGHDEGDALLVTSEFTHPNNYTERVHMGLQYTLMRMFTVSGGYVTNHDLNGLSLGVGFQTEVVGSFATSVNYTYSSIKDYFDDVNRISVMFSF